MHPQKRSLAIFDVDRTLIKGDSFLLFGKFLLGKRRPRVGEAPRLAALALGYLAGTAEAGTLKGSLLRMAAGGARSAEMAALAEEFTAKVLLPRVYLQAQERIQWHRSSGHRLVFLSASPAMYLEKLGEKLEVEAVIATRFKWRDGVFLGELDGRNCKGEEKLARLLTACDDQQIDWQNSYYYADSVADLPVFEKVGHPVLVNPQSKLARIGAQRRWPVEIWR